MEDVSRNILGLVKVVYDYINVYNHPQKLKPVYQFHVTHLVTCPFRALAIERTREEKERMNKGKEIHRIIQEELRKKGYEIEKDISYIECFNDYCIELLGHIDALHPIKHEIIEIKPYRIVGAYHRQLSAYANMLYLRTRENYSVYWMRYRILNGKIFVQKQKLFWWDMAIVPRLIKLAKAIIERNQLLKIENDTCKYCKLKGICQPHGKWVDSFGWEIKLF